MSLSERDAAFRPLYGFTELHIDRAMWARLVPATTPRLRQHVLPRTEYRLREVLVAVKHRIAEAASTTLE